MVADGVEKAGVVRKYELDSDQRIIKKFTNYRGMKKNHKLGQVGKGSVSSVVEGKC